MMKLLEFAAIRAAYRDGSLTPAALFAKILTRIENYPDQAVFIFRVPAETVLAAASALDVRRMDELPLFGVPFVVKDNIDVAGMQTTAACPAFAYTAERDAAVVARLRAAGAIVLGKANLDQFATGLNGTRSPYGAPRCVFDGAYISGGSSSGSAVAVGAGLCAFALGTDTAGSGRVPAMFNNVVGLKPTVGRLPATGVVPAMKSLDCVSVFANCVADAVAVLRVAQGVDEGDAYSRVTRDVGFSVPPVVGVLSHGDRFFAGDEEVGRIYKAAVAQAGALGWKVVEIDYAPFLKIAESLYGGAFVAERLAAIKGFFVAHAEEMNPVVRGIVAGAEKYSAADLFEEIYRFKGESRVARVELEKCDFLVLPTAPTIFTVEAMVSEPVKLNSVLGTYTNFVNLMDLAAIAVPAGFRADGLPVGVTLVGPAFSDAVLAGFGESLHLAMGAGAGVSRGLPVGRLAAGVVDDVTVVVAGAHLSGMALNHELLALGARLMGAAKTAKNYRLFALDTVPAKPGLVRVKDEAGEGIDVEVWALTAESFGRFVAMLPAPMGIGKVTLADGSVHPGFLCEVGALEGAEDITGYGGWRQYRSK
jgi:allophanate hydrolase